jgi:hypothetical protein
LKRIDEKMREEQADFRKGRGCIDNMFAIRNIIEQCTESKTPLFINYIDFKKAFDSVHRETLWKIPRSYGILLVLLSSFHLFFSTVFF